MQLLAGLAPFLGTVLLEVLLSSFSCPGAGESLIWNCQCRSALVAARRMSCCVSCSVFKQAGPRAQLFCQHRAPSCSSSSPVTLLPNCLQSPPPKLPFYHQSAERDLGFESPAGAVPFCTSIYRLDSHSVQTLQPSPAHVPQSPATS